MTEARAGSLRILFDMQACQTEGSAKRGVGRFCSNLFEGVASIAAPRELFALTSKHLPHGYMPRNICPSRVIEAGALPDWRSERSFRGGNRDALDDTLTSASCQAIKPDVVHISHLFEGYGERLGIFNPAHRVPGQVVSATVHDLIPLIFDEHYLRDPGFRRWYFDKLTWLRKADLLLTNSESTRQDTIRLLGVEPWRVVTVHGGMSGQFHPPEDRAAARARLLEGFNLRERVVLYTGGDDHRKNISGAIRAFAKVDPEVRANSQLVIVCAMQPERMKMYMAEANSVGLKGDDVLVTGYVSEQDLVDFYGSCDLFVFPSLYEGLGLPVLEAMACGAPVIGGDNSSVKELIARKDALFDASSDESIAGRITQVLTDEGFSNDLRGYGIERARGFSWQRSAEISIAAFDEAVSRARQTGVKSSVNGWLPKKRLAVLTPLPPTRSGIADYNARFLPFLARHFEIDLYVDGYRVEDETVSSTFRIYDARDFERVAGSYDIILYEIGNSEFHIHMVPLLEKYPGVVGLHDAYLSGLFWYWDYRAGNKGRLEREMILSHGPNARKYFAPAQACADPLGGSMVNLPCTKGVLDLALGVISHSAFNLDMAREFYPQGMLAPYRIIPQMVVRPEAITGEGRRSLRSELGFGPDDFIVVTFGHISWTKWGDRLLDAFLNSALSDMPDAHLVFAGKLSEDDFGMNLKANIRKSKFRDRIRITGFLSTGDYEKYLRVADLAVQFRTKSRGGTPKGVLDCMAYGVPVIVNNDASYTDYPDDVVIKLDPHPGDADIVRMLEGLASDRERLAGYAERAFKYVAEKHDPTVSAAAYAAALHEFSEREHATRDTRWVDALAPYIGGTPEARVNAEHAASYIGAMKKTRWRARRLYVDVSHIIEFDHETGIQRVVKETVKGLYTTGFKGFDPVAVELKDGELVEAREWLDSKGLLSKGDGPVKVEFERGDVLLMLDSSWARYSEFHPVFESARRAHVPVVTAVYDILPITLPPGYFVDGGREWFEGWFRDAVDKSDGFICISRATADEVIRYVTGHCPEKKALKVGHWQLGSDIKGDGPGDEGAGRAAEVKGPYLFVIGTVEPRKSHALILDAMEMAWAKGVELNLCVAGKAGWMVDKLMERMREHPEAGKRFFLVEKPTDAEVKALYRGASALLFMSVGEGFGLPLVEASHHGVPIICSDIPVFREVAGEYATYVKPGSAEAVCDGIVEWLAKKERGELPDTRKMPRVTWEESATQLSKALFHEGWYWSM